MDTGCCCIHVPRSLFGGEPIGVDGLMKRVSASGVAVGAGQTSNTSTARRVVLDGRTLTAIAADSIADLMVIDELSALCRPA